MLTILFFCFIQGFTEFLPVSSQGHLILFNNYFSIYSSDISIDQAAILAHFGSLIAVIVYYNKTLKGFISSVKLLDRPDIDKNSFLVINLIISSIPIFIAGYIVSKLINYETEMMLVIIGSTSILFGLILFIVDKFCLRIKNINSLDYYTSFLIGVFQCFALIPGVSRSGSILTAMRFFGFQRSFSVNYSNLLSIPVILGATSYLFLSAFEENSLNLIISFSSLIIFSLSFIFSFLFIFFFVSWVKKFSLSIFVIYRFIFGGWILIYLI